MLESLLAPYNVLLYAFSAVPNKPFPDISAFPELAPLREHWETIRDEGQAQSRHAIAPTGAPG